MRSIATHGLIVLMLAAVAALPCWAEVPVCPKCGAPLEPGAAFCIQCGQPVETPPAPAAGPDPLASVVQVVAAHDTELTSAYVAIVHGASVEVGSILGSAFAVAPGEFLTDAGLMIGAREITLRTAGGRVVPTRVLGIDPMIGVALLAADLPEIRPLPLRSGGLPRPGEALTALGFPSRRRASRDLATSVGVVSGLHRAGMRIHPIEDFIQTDASLPDGFAGGPLADATGTVVGMSTAWVSGPSVVLGPESGIGLAVPVPWIERGLGWIRSGSPPRPWMGAYAAALDDEGRKAHRLPEAARFRLEMIFPGSPAEAAGLKRGDGLVTIQGQEPGTLAEMHSRLLGTRPGESLSLEVARGGERLTVTVRLAARPDRARLEGADALLFFGGLEIAPRGPSALAVTRVLRGTPASDAKVAPGDVLQSLLVKKDLRHAERRTAWWRSARDLEDLQRLVANGYSDLDFFLGLRFRGKDGTKREMYLWEILTASDAL